jgi:low affinity Fe/Cu permease
MINTMKETFRKAAGKVSSWAGSATVFIGAFLIIFIWAITGPMFHYSDTWQLVINTGTTIVTFLMVFLIQNTQNRDSKAVQMKLDELIRVTKGARLHYLGLEDMNDDELTTLDAEFKHIMTKPGVAGAVTKLQERITAEHQRRRGIQLLSIFHRPEIPVRKPNSPQAVPIEHSDSPEH